MSDSSFHIYSVTKSQHLVPYNTCAEFPILGNILWKFNTVINKLWSDPNGSQVTRSWRTVILSTSLKLRTYLNLRTPVLKFKYDCNPHLLSAYCKITFENLCSTKRIPHNDIVSMNGHLVDRKRNRWHPDIIVKNKINHSSAQKP